MAYQPIFDPSSRGVASLLGSFVNPADRLKGITGMLDRRVDELNKEQDRQDRLAREAKQDAQWEKQFKLQEMANTRAGLQADREAQKYAQDLATAEAQAKASEYLNAARSNVVTPTQADAILAAYQKNPRADVLGMQAQAVKQYEASPAMQKQFISSVNIDQGPMERTIQTVDPRTGQVVDRILQATPDMKEAQARKDMILAGLDKTISEDKRLQSEWDMLKAREAGENARLGRRLAAAKEEAKGKEPKVPMFRMMPDGMTHRIDVPISAAKRYESAGFTLGTVGGSRLPTGSRDGKSVGTNLAEDIGSIDTARVQGVANILRLSGLPAATAEGLAELSKERTLLGTGVNFNKILEPAYVELKKKNPNITKGEVAELLNQAF